MPTSRIVQGDILLPATGIPGHAATVVVQVEDVSRADAPSEVVGEERMQRVELQPGQPLSFRVEVPGANIDERRSYSVRVHVDVTGSGEVELGDLVSTQSYPVLTRGHPDHASIRVQRV